ncbi:DUF4304 domain-containing protein [Achromobacter deleyi]|uniref:DUF4304 domain-containing protein n=1 Tax=Achromobacter deleyi TaxID=1353891 RepID=UPI0014684E65|nr:DUF4304 domain-containing protein [Achromobacter deleyi]CAB3861242.1 hypothetical protein LMG3412_02273 [Achromobacter deleyi]
MATVTRAAFLKLLTQHLIPVLKAEGFEGTGQTLRRIRGPIIHVFNIQGASGGKACYLNLGAHYDFLPCEGGAFVPPAEIEESHCVFRDRIDPPPGEAYGWAYGADLAQAEENVEFIVSEWARVGHAFFAQHDSYPASCERLVQGTDPDSIHPAKTLIYARIAQHLGDTARAHAFIQSGLARAPAAATSLKAKLEEALAG